MNLKTTSRIALVLLACSAALTSRGDYPTTVISQGPVAYYRLDGTTAPPPPASATNIGSLGTNANGTYVGDPPRGLTGPLAGGIDKAISLDGVGQDVQAAYSASLNPATFTIEAWLKPATATPSGGLLCALASMESASPRAGWLVYQSGPGGVGNGFNLRLYATNGSATSVSILAGTNLVAGNWYHFVATYDGTTAKVYVNGVLLNSAAGAFVPNPDAVLSVGMRSDTGFRWPGQAAEVAYYSSALSVLQIQAHYNASISNAANYGSIVSADAPIVYYRFTEPAEPIAPNLGSLGSAADATYVFNALPGQTGPGSPAYPGFAAGNKAVGFDGLSGYVRIPALNLNSANITMTAWVNLNGSQSPNAGIVYSDSGVTQAGLKMDFVSPTDLAYNWSSAAAGNFSSALTMTPGQWSFVALSTFPDHAVLSLQNGTSFASATNFTPNATLPFSGFTLIGSDGGASNLTFNGSIDEVAIFNRSLSQGEIYTEYSAASGTNPPVIFNNPQAPAGTVYVTDPLNLNVDAGGTPALSYQWFKGVSPIVGATNSTFSIPSLVLSDSGTYSASVSNAFGVVTSGGAVINVNPLASPSITTNPVGRTIYAGGLLDLTVVATGGGLHYQWFLGATPLAGATASSYVVAHVAATNAGTYTVTVSNTVSTATSSGAVITVITPTAGSYESVVLADSPEAWWRLNDPLSSTVMADNVGRHDGAYNGGVTQGSPGLPFSSSTSATFDGNNGTFGSVPYTPVLNSENFTVEAWVKTTNTVTDMGVFSSFTSLSGSPYHGKGYFIHRTTGDIFQGGIGQNDQFSYYFIDMNPTVASKWTHVAISFGPGGLNFYQDGKLAQGGFGDFVRNTTEPFLIGAQFPGLYDNYWQGQIADVAYYLTNLSAAQINAHYQAGLYSSNSAPVFIVQPAPQTAVQGNNATFSASVEGSLPITLQWLKNSSPISGATNASLTLSNVFYTDAANYQLQAANTAGTNTSAGASLTVLAPPSYVNATNGLVLHLKFDGDTVDSSGRGNNGTAVGGPVFVPGKIGTQALQYTTTTAGDVSGGAVTTASYVTLGVVPDLEFGATTNFSISLWAKMPTNYHRGDLPFFGNTVNSTGGNGYLVAPGYTNGGWAWSLGSGGSAVIGNGAANSINNGNWHNLIFTFDRTGNGTTYLDGVQVDATGDAAGGNVDTGVATVIGQDPTGTYPEPGSATIDDVGVWNRVLTPYEAYAINFVGQSGTSFDSFGPVKLTLQKVPGGYGIIWQAGTLQSSTTVNGTYTTVVGANAPFYQFTPTGTSQFYRVKLQ